jgi:hypothetical protein
MIRNIKSRKSIALMALRVIWKFALLFLQVVASFASDEKSKPRYTALKAQELYDDGLISMVELNKSIHPNDAG